MLLKQRRAELSTTKIVVNYFILSFLLLAWSTLQNSDILIDHAT